MVKRTIVAFLAGSILQPVRSCWRFPYQKSTSPTPMTTAVHAISLAGGTLMSCGADLQGNTCYGAKRGAEGWLARRVDRPPNEEASNSLRIAATRCTRKIQQDLHATFWPSGSNTRGRIADPLTRRMPGTIERHAFHQLAFPDVLVPRRKSASDRTSLATTAPNTARSRGIHSPSAIRPRLPRGLRGQVTLAAKGAHAHHMGERHSFGHRKPAHYRAAPRLALPEI